MANLPITYEKAKSDTIDSYHSYMRGASSARLYRNGVFQDGEIIERHNRYVHRQITWTDPSEIRFFSQIIKVERDWYMDIRPQQVEYRTNTIRAWRDSLHFWMHEAGRVIEKSPADDILDFVDIAPAIDIVMKEFPDEVPAALNDWWLMYEILK